MNPSTPEPMLLAAALATAAPLLLLGFGILPRTVLEGRPRMAAAALPAVASLSLVCAVLGSLVGLSVGTVHHRWLDLGGLGIGVWLDRLSAVVLALVAFLLVVVARFARGYLEGDPGQGRFSRWLALTGGSVLVLVLADNLAQFFAGWLATSLCLHQLLVFHPERSAGRLAARKKFVVSRLGDFCLLGAMGLVWARFGTWDFEALFRIARGLHGSGLGADAAWIHGTVGLLVAGALLKSAQFPFHSWLPDTMETPTPVSALMHAGIINAGGFLILRLEPLATLSPGSMAVLAVVGAFTAVFASVVALTQASVKRALAFSTVGQMGFMMLECGLGAFPLALLHLVSHSLYKAHAFLASGGAVSRAEPHRARLGGEAVGPLVLLVAVGVAACGVLGIASVMRVELRGHPGTLVGAGVLAMSLAHVGVHALGRRPGAATLLGLGAGGGLLAAASLGLHRAAEWWLAPVLVAHHGLPPVGGTPLVAAILVLFLAALALQAVVPGLAERPAFRSLYVHARNGFYINTLANRMAGALRASK